VNEREFASMSQTTGTEGWWLIYLITGTNWFIRLVCINQTVSGKAIVSVQTSASYFTWKCNQIL
jgi:hypothetical protein